MSDNETLSDNETQGEKWYAGKPELAICYPELSRSDFHRAVKEMHEKAALYDGQLPLLMRRLTERNLFYFVVYVLQWTFLDNDFAYALSCACQDERRYGTLWLLAREHYKSTIITIAETIRQILLHPESTTCIYSYKFDSSKDLFFTPIKNELEHNPRIRIIWPDVVYCADDKPQTWTATSINVKRKTRRKEYTLTCASIFSQVTGSHYDNLIFDDAVIEENCQTADRIAQTQKQWELSLNTGNTRSLKYCVIGTYYAYGDLYCHIKDMQLCRVVTQPCFAPDGRGVLYSAEALEEKRRVMGSGVFATQMLLDPKLGAASTFHAQDIMWCKLKTFAGLNVYTFVDPAGEVSRHRDNTVILTLAVDAARNWYILDMVRDKLTLSQKTQELFRVKRQYDPRIVFYEKNGAAIDVPHIRQEMERYNYRFPIQPIVQSKSKQERIEALMPLFEQHRIYFPDGGCHHVNWEGKDEDMLHSFIIEEFLAYPHSTHDDALDDLANILHPTCTDLMQIPDADSMEEQIYNALHSKFRDLTPFRPNVEDYNPLGDYFKESGDDGYNPLMDMLGGSGNSF